MLILYFTITVCMVNTIVLLTNYRLTRISFVKNNFCWIFSGEERCKTARERSGSRIRFRMTLMLEVEGDDVFITHKLLTGLLYLNLKPYKYRYINKVFRFCIKRFVIIFIFYYSIMYRGELKTTWVWLKYVYWGNIKYNFYFFWYILNTFVVCRTLYNFCVFGYPTCLYIRSTN